MNIKYFLLIVFTLCFSLKGKSQIENVIVETYYVSDSLDATDTTDNRVLEAGSKTYRIYIDLVSGSKLKKIYGDSRHLFKISSTDTFYNNIDRPTAYFGYLINKVWFPSNPTLALDSWLTLGRAAKNYYGVIKSEDTDSSFIGGNNNYGGSSLIPGGILVNADTLAGIPLTSADGFLPDTTTLSQWIDYGFKDLSGVDTTIFGSVNLGTSYISDTAFLKQINGVSGANSDNKVLVAQLTTRGEISFELNVVVIDTNGNDINYVAKGNDTSYISSGQPVVEHLCSYLTYPPVCGCRDPAYLEYSAAYACDNFDSCKTLIVYGCLDSAACNYDASANFNIPSLCCYPGFCNDRDISVVCPSLNLERYSKTFYSLFPNPSNNEINLQITNAENCETQYEIFDSVGNKVLKKQLGIISGPISQHINISELQSGLYLFRLYVNGKTECKMFSKN